MKLLFDQNLSFRLKSSLKDLFPESSHVNECGLERATDDEIWLFAAANGYAIVSKDSDFYHRSMLLGHPPKVVWVQLGNCTTNEIVEVLKTHHEDLLAFDADNGAAFLIIPKVRNS